MNYNNFKQFCDKFNRITEANPDSLSVDDRQFLRFWLVELSMAFLRDLDDKDLGKDVARTMEFLCEQC